MSNEPTYFLMLAQQTRISSALGVRVRLGDGGKVQHGSQ